MSLEIYPGDQDDLSRTVRESVTALATVMRYCCNGIFQIHTISEMAAKRCAAPVSLLHPPPAADPPGPVYCLRQGKYAIGHLKKGMGQLQRCECAPAQHKRVMWSPDTKAKRLQAVPQSDDYDGYAGT